MALLRLHDMLFNARDRWDGEMGDLTTHEAIAEHFQALRNEVQSIAGKVNDLKAEAQEHELVSKSLANLDPSRKCFRLIGEVLVERTVADVLPAVKGNQEQLELLATRLVGQLQTKKQELAEFQDKYKIRIRSASDLTTAEPSIQQQAAQGVLVSKS